MNRFSLMTLLLIVAAPAISAPPPELRSALTEWAAPRSIARFQFSRVDLNGDGNLDAVVHVTDPDFCGNGGCPLVVFKGASMGYELAASSGLVRKPIYVLEEAHSGWLTLAAAVGLGKEAGVVPIRFREQERAYTSRPYMRAQIALSSTMTKRVLDFEEVP